MATPDLGDTPEEIEVVERPTHEAQDTVDRILQIQSDAEDSDADNDPKTPRDSKAVAFSPVKVVQSEEELIKIIKENSRENVTARVYRLLVIVAFLVFLLPFTEFTPFQLLQCLAFGELFLMLGYAGHLFGIVFYAYCHSETGLYRIYTLNSMPPKWARMSISYRALLYESQPLESISEFSAIQGGMASTMLFGTATATLSVVACAFAADLQYEDFNLHATDILILFGAFGLVTIGTFELDPFNKLMIKLHYLGVLLSTGIFIGFNWQQVRMNWTHDKNNQCKPSLLWYPIFLDVLALSGFISWQISLKRGKKYQEKLLNAKSLQHDPHKISRFSIVNLASEGVFFVAAGLSLCSWLFFYPINKACKCDQSTCCSAWIVKLSSQC